MRLLTFPLLLLTITCDNSKVDVLEGVNDADVDVEDAAEYEKILVDQREKDTNRGGSLALEVEVYQVEQWRTAVKDGAKRVEREEEGARAKARKAEAKRKKRKRLAFMDMKLQPQADEPRSISPLVPMCVARLSGSIIVPFDFLASKTARQSCQSRHNRVKFVIKPRHQIDEGSKSSGERGVR
ncbi:hypothetical protein H0H92_010442 [Tricholoma furcatifolium]|nr:hypothetical protein H0H92_010442 [Tricholoma furcatifolium]